MRSNKTGRPIVATPSMEAPIRKKIKDFLRQELFMPILKSVIETERILFNATTSALQEAIISGAIRYFDGIFRGRFSAKISFELQQIGAKFDKKVQAYRLPVSQVPPNIQSALAQAKMNFETLNIKIVSALDKIDVDEAMKNLDFTVNYDSVIQKVDGQFKKTITPSIGLEPQLMPSAKNKIAREYSDNLKTYVKKFTIDESKKLRTLVEQSYFSGARDLEKAIKERYAVSDNKAKFLARQETNLIAAKYSQTLYEDAGLTKYEWSTTPHGGSGVRPDHAALNGQIFSFDDPPIVDKATGRRANPGEDYNCYCKALPVFD